MTVHSKPIIVNPDKSTVLLEPVPLTNTELMGSYSEAWLQDLLYRHPEAIPVAELDTAFAGMIPVCRELTTDAGPVDILYTTPTGKLVVLEAKLWRNPEARRKVVGQILDYAKELSRLDYESLDARVRQARKKEIALGGPSGLADVARARVPNLRENEFIDSVSRTLQRGDFLLLIVGDGIREGVGAITEFLEGYGTLHFGFGLIEVGIFQTPDGGHLVCPRVLAQSAIIRRIVVSVEGSRARVEENSGTEHEALDPAIEETRSKFTAFWAEVVSMLESRLDDKSQKIFDPTRTQNYYLYMPTQSRSWISAHVSQSRGCIGVYLTFERGHIGNRLYERLCAEREVIDRELGIDVKWESADGKHAVSCEKHLGDDILTKHRAPAKEWLCDRMNRFVTAFRPRIERMISQLNMQ
jgi:hypothetical protein